MQVVGDKYLYLGSFNSPGGLLLLLPKPLKLTRRTELVEQRALAWPPIARVGCSTQTFQPAHCPCHSPRTPYRRGGCPCLRPCLCQVSRSQGECALMAWLLCWLQVARRLGGCAQDPKHVLPVGAGVTAASPLHRLHCCSGFSLPAYMPASMSCRPSSTSTCRTTKTSWTTQTATTQASPESGIERSCGM